jgi:hypothetical protein
MTILMRHTDLRAVVIENPLIHHAAVPRILCVANLVAKPIEQL